MAPVSCSSHSVVIALDVFQVLVYFPPNGVFWGGFIGNF